MTNLLRFEPTMEIQGQAFSNLRYGYAAMVVILTPVQNRITSRGLR